MSTVASYAALAAARARGESEIVAILALANAPDVISFAGGVPDPATFPGEAVAAIAADLAGDPTAFQYSPTGGLPSTRDWLAARLERLEGLRPADAELMVTSGGMEALELIGKAFLEPGDIVLVEAPTYLGALMSFRSFDARIESVPLDADGLELDALAAAIEGARPKLLYTIPEYQNPAGVTLAAERREAVVELARRHGVLVVEDVAYRDLGFDDERRPSLWSLAPDAVLQVGTFSKTFFPGMRLGWAAGPPEVVDRLQWAKQLTDQCPSALGQRLLEEYGRRGLLDEGIVRSRALYGRRAARTVEALTASMPAGVSWTEPRGGFFTWLTLGPGADSVELARRAAEAGVAVVPGTPFFPDGRGGGHVRLAFSRVGDDEIAEGIARLAALL